MVSLGYVIVTRGAIFHVEFWLWCFFGLLYQCTGFIHNSLLDYPYDKVNPYKQHFPLVSGLIKYETAQEVQRCLIVVTAVYLAWLSRGQVAVLILFAMASLLGCLYNVFNKKRPVFASFSFLVSYFLLTLLSFVSHLNRVSWVMGLVAGYCALNGFIQVAVLGAVKDIEADTERNILGDLGCKVVEGRLIFGSRVWAYAVSVKATEGAALLGLIISAKTTVFPLLLSTTFFVLSAVFYAMHFSKDFNHNRILKFHPLHDACVYVSLLLALEAIIGVTTIIVITLFSLIWLFVWMRIGFGEWRLGPKI